MWTLLPAPGEKYWECKEIFSSISCSRLLCFSFKNIVFERFPCVNWSSEACSWKKVAKKNVNKSQKIMKWSVHTACRFLHKKWLWMKDQLTHGLRTQSDCELVKGNIIKVGQESKSMTSTLLRSFEIMNWSMNTLPPRKMWF